MLPNTANIFSIVSKSLHPAVSVAPETAFLVFSPRPFPLLSYQIFFLLEFRLEVILKKGIVETIDTFPLDAGEAKGLLPKHPQHHARTYRWKKQ
jgi:hypothetical protein